MTTAVDSSVERIRTYVRPSYVAFPLANVVLLVVAAVRFERVVAIPGQGGRIDVFVWPTYWGSYEIVDVGFALPEIGWGAFLANYALGVTPVYVACVLAVNGLGGSGWRRWVPAVDTWHYVVAAVGLLVAYIPASLFGYYAVYAWVAAVATLAYTILHDSARSTSASA